MLHYNRAELLSVYDRMRSNIKEGLPTMAGDVMKIPVARYSDSLVWTAEVDRVFRRKPIMLAFSSELPSPGSYLARTILDTPLLLVRAQSGEIKAYLNACRHRGMKLVQEGSGQATRFTCLYHAWTYSGSDGRLLAIPDAQSFGAVDKACLGLTGLPVEERDGLIWGILTPGLEMDLDNWLGDLGPLLSQLELSQYDVFTSAELQGVNWKLVMEGYLETYHFASLHKTSFNPVIHGNMTVIDLFSRHGRLCTAMRGIEEHEPPQDHSWDVNTLVQHSFWLFPNLQISFGAAPSEGEPLMWALVSQVFPGTNPEESTTIQRVITSRNVRGSDAAQLAQGFADFAFGTVRTEDMPATIEIQKTLKSGANKEFVVGRNEILVQHLHRGLEGLVGDIYARVD